MRYLVLIYSEEPTSTPPPAPLDEIRTTYRAYTGMLRERGAFVDGDELEPTTTATTIRVRDGQMLITDGPFAETKEALGGYYLIEAADLDEAIELAKACPGAAWGSIEVRPINGQSGG
ncbi:MAG: YciI family protein [Candidatus Limnocylindrales bacterium]